VDLFDNLQHYVAGPDALICIVIALLPPVKRAFERIMPAQKTA
jgi:hypothetical protein